MAEASLDSTSYAWKKIADNWEEHFFAPSRPSVQEVAKYREWLSKISGGKKWLNGLVMGATPELRDTLNELEFNTHSIDINLEMMQALNGLVKHKNADEVLIRANWLENPLRDSYFDVVLGDAVFPNVPWGARGKLYKEIVRWLRPGGYFINRAFFAPEKRRFTSIDEVLEGYRGKEPTNETAMRFVFDVHLLTHDPKDRLGSMAKVKDVVEALRGPDGFKYPDSNLNKTLDIVWSYWLSPGVLGKVWIYPFEKEEEAEYEKYFQVEGKFSASDHPYGQLTPMYLLNRKPPGKKQ